MTVKRKGVLDPELIRTQRQTVVSQFYQMDKLVVEGGKSVSCNIIWSM